MCSIILYKEAFHPARGLGVPRHAHVVAIALRPVFQVILAGDEVLQVRVQRIGLGDRFQGGDIVLRVIGRESERCSAAICNLIAVRITNIHLNRSAPFLRGMSHQRELRSGERRNI